MVRQPDIVVICTDQQRRDTIAAAGAGWMRTPHLDQLVARGVCFDQACTPCPVCMPARWSMMTGLLPSHHGCHSNHHPGLRPEQDLASTMRRAGYRTALIGKNHTFYDERDWDFCCTDPAPLDAGAAERRRRWDDAQACARLGDGPAAGGLAGDADVAKTDAALAWLGRAAAQPRFLFLSYLAPHTPYRCPEPFWSRYTGDEIPGPVLEPDGLRGKPRRQRFHRWNNDAVLSFDSDQVRRMRATYAAQVSLIDHEVGRLVAALDAGGRDTLLVFTSDHGDYQGDHGLFTKSPALYDCLVRVPMLVVWPGRAAAGRRDGRPVSHVDLLPSLADAAGSALDSAVDGASWLPLLGDPHAPWRRYNALEYGFAGPGVAPLPPEPWAPDQVQRNPGDSRLPWEGNPLALAGALRGVRGAGWKLIWDENGEHEFYDLTVDPQELVNLHPAMGWSAQMAEAAAEPSGFGTPD